MPGLNTDEAIEAVHVTPVPGAAIYDLGTGNSCFGLVIFCPLQLLSCIFLDFLLTYHHFRRRVQVHRLPQICVYCILVHT